MLLRGHGYDVMTAPNGAAALDLLRVTRPHAILLDMRMPIMDGREFARAYRQLPGPHAPIIVATSGLDAEVSAAEIGADGYVAKPFEADQLAQIFDRCQAA